MNDDKLIYTFAKEHVIRASGLLSLLMPQTSGVGIGVKGLDGRYQLANHAMEALLGKSAEQITGLTDEDLFPPEVSAQLKRSDLQITQGAAAASDELEFAVHGASARCLWLKFPVLGPDGAILFIGAVMLDIARQENYAEMRQSLDQLQQTNQELEKILVDLDSLASTDKLTGAWNRRRLEEALGNEMDRLKRYGHPLSLLIIDVDSFRKVNDHHGEATGDQVLMELAAVVQPSLRTADSLTRWGGDEFVVLCPNTPLATVTVLAERLREQIAKVNFPEVNSITASIGVAQCLAGETQSQWFDRADAALYRAKANGRNQVQTAL
jgi:diguanylate cyclase (GGDEF)-like protein/PAS domain S-box-containing protein